MKVGSLEEQEQVQEVGRKIAIDDASFQAVSDLMRDMGWAIEERYMVIVVLHCHLYVFIYIYTYNRYSNIIINCQV